MRILNGEQYLVRVFIDESEKWQHRPLYMALVEKLREEGFAGATVFRGVAGFGAGSILHTRKILSLSEKLPVVVEIVDSEEQIEQLIPMLDEMVPEGLVTMEKVRVLKYAPVEPPSAGDSPTAE